MFVELFFCFKMTVIHSSLKEKLMRIAFEKKYFFHFTWEAIGD